MKYGIKAKIINLDYKIHFGEIDSVAFADIELEDGNKEHILLPGNFLYNIFYWDKEKDTALPYDIEVYYDPTFDEGSYRFERILMPVDEIRR